MRGQVGDELRQRGIAYALIVGAAPGEADRLARTLAEGDRHLAVEPGEIIGLESRGAHFIERAPADQIDDPGQRAPTQYRDGVEYRQMPVHLSASPARNW